LARGDQVENGGLPRVQQVGQLPGHPVVELVVVISMALLVQSFC
jgi:hypothetical protein